MIYVAGRSVNCMHSRSSNNEKYVLNTVEIEGLYIIVTSDAAKPSFAHFVYIQYFHGYQTTTLASAEKKRQHNINFSLAFLQHLLTYN